MNIFIAGVLFCGLLVITVLWKFSGRSSSNNKMLALSLFCVCYAMLINQFIYTGFLVKVPHLSRTAIIAGNLIMPFFYVYVRNTFYPGRIWRDKDWWLLAPAVFYIIDLFPYFILSGEEKVKKVPMIFGDNYARWRVDEGWISPYWFPILLLYTVASFLWVVILKMVLQNKQMEGETISKTNKPLFNMIVVLTVSYFFLSFPGFLGALLDVPWFNVYFLAFSLSTTLLVVCVFLVFSPRILYGFVYSTASTSLEPGIQKERAPDFEPVRAKREIGKTHPNGNATAQILVDDDLQTGPILEKLDQFMQEKKPFLKPGLSIHDLSQEIEVPVYTLSKIINSGKGMNYSRWLNRYRIDHFIELYQSVDNHHFTLESLAQKSGFVSRVTFIKTFKKEMNVTPTQYIKDHFKKDLA